MENSASAPQWLAENFATDTGNARGQQEKQAQL